MGLRKLSRSECTQLFQNWVLLLVILSQTIRLHRYWLTRVAKDADSLKRLSSVRVINFVQKDTGEMFPEWEFDVEDTLAENIIKLFVQKDIGEMFPKWEFDVEDTPAENIIKLMFVKKPWKWTMDC
uniref:Uncharacterized protein n=1 Tax=Brassica oleracea var. oleracea TaxID=109376 RepID=A0A0D3D5A7_BRAOL